VGWNTVWIESVFFTHKAVVGMIHLPPLPGTPLHDDAGGVQTIVDSARADLHALQDGGIDGVMFCNENDRPYELQVGPETVSAMASVIGQLKHDIRIPFGVDVLWDPVAAISIAHATGAAFVREVFTGTYASDMGLWNTRSAEALRFRKRLGANVKLLFNINAEFASSFDNRPLPHLAKSVVFSSIPDALCVSGPMTGSEVDVDHLKVVKDVVGNVPIFVNTGVRKENVRDQLEHADACIVGTGLKYDGVTWNNVDPERVKTLMSEVNDFRKNVVEQRKINNN
jgi:membrane complex biogenesis BtpA family protein